jgi:hypothetical protein
VRAPVHATEAVRALGNPNQPNRGGSGPAGRPRATAGKEGEGEAAATASVSPGRNGTARSCSCASTTACAYALLLYMEIAGALDVGLRRYVLGVRASSDSVHVIMQGFGG